MLPELLHSYVDFFRNAAFWRDVEIRLKRKARGWLADLPIVVGIGQRRAIYLRKEDLSATLMTND